MPNTKYKVIAFDLDGTLTQHRSPLGDENRIVLNRLAENYRLVMVGAGTCQRIWKQMGCYPIDVIGSYGMQFARYNAHTKSQDIIWDEHFPVDSQKQMQRATALRERYHLYPYAGDSIEIHPTGALTFPVLGTAAKIDDKLSYDPDRCKRRGMYAYVKDLFCDYQVVIGGSSSFDIIPGQYGKLNGLKRYAQLEGVSLTDIVYCGDDYYEGGNDYDIYTSGLPFIKIDNYQRLAIRLMEQNLLTSD